MKRMKLLLAVAILLVTALQGHAQTPTGTAIPLDATVSADGQSVELRWFDAVPPRAEESLLSRRPLGATGSETWQPLARLPGTHIRTTDDTIIPGVAYEYRLFRRHAGTFSAGYWATGTDIPAPQDRGTVFIALENSLTALLQPRLTRLEDDLTGAGWQVQWLGTPRHQSDAIQTLIHARALKQRLRDGLNAQAPGRRHMLLLLGHVPLVLSGSVGPDGHHPEPHASDLFYGDLSGVWRDNGAGILMHDRLPDGDIELPVGRVDFAQIAGGDTALEQAHLRAYLDKTHHWRHGVLGDLRVAYGQTEHLQVEKFDLRNVLGPEALTTGGHHNAGETQPWLWGLDFGHWKGADYAGYAIKPVFAMNFGSGKQKINKRNNAIIGLLAQPFYTVAVAWGARPSWRLHHMALGHSIGQMQMVTVNNGAQGGRYPEGMDYVPTGAYPWRAPIWVNLLGDPTLTAFPLPAPRNLRAVAQDGRVRLDWQGAAGRYQLLRASPDGAYTLLADITAAHEFIDETPIDGARYQLRALGKQTVYAGSFHTASQGVFAQVGVPPVSAPDLRQTLSGAGPHRVIFDQQGALLAPIHPPEVGRLTLTGDGWHYLAPNGFSGGVEIAVSASGSGGTAIGRLVLDITP